ncbi:hypothetical protein NCAS_0I01310 [Naumovozyma castellii]|uniref:Uncharacterized protein n=1 Tax=Naumovozyma castellii TaxID=27288 RepID=G0VJW7_NAUCA|nr:hypothetical protein NCAS_0I01310 [Naumovozyma castellii CBS 4309]CCC71799.1 hypothetical protein NCAS_0I01310 [Naumovozyma castellii CBS 4309]
MSSTIYNTKANFSHSTGSFLRSAPVELTTRAGYEDFIRKQNTADISTILEKDNGSQGYILKNNEVIATVSGEAKDYLYELAGN